MARSPGRVPTARGLSAGSALGAALVLALVFALGLAAGRALEPRRAPSPPFRAPAGADAADGAPRPIWHYLALVAGQATPGHADGPFTKARFRQPISLAASPDGRLLAVADRENHRVRLVHLDEANRVETVAGTGAPGRKDGPRAEADFYLPNAVAFLSNEALVVAEEGSARFRLVDLSAGTVSTFAGNGATGVEDGDASAASLGAVFAIAVDRERGALYFTQPEVGRVRRVDLKTRRVSTILKDDPRLPHPAPVALHGGALVVADRDGPVYLFGMGKEPALAENAVPIETLRRPIALASTGEALYALEAEGEPPLVRLPPRAPVLFRSVWGMPLETRREANATHLRIGTELPGGLVASPRGARELFVSGRGLDAILAVKDYAFERHWDARDERGDEITDVDYPEKKPAGVFRILIAGDSHLFYETPLEEARWNGRYNRMETLPKRLELFLSTWAALEGKESRYEVLMVGRGSWHPLEVWTRYLLPPLARRYDVDLVLVAIPPEGSTLYAYLDRPATREGIPAAEIDPEHLLLPWREKVATSAAKEFFTRAEAAGLFHGVSETQAELQTGFPELVTRPDLRPLLLDLMSRPIRALAKDVAGKGSPERRTALVFLPLGRRGASDEAAAFWSEAAAGLGLPLVNLAPDADLLRETYFPLSEMDSFDHYHAGGHAVGAFLLARRLVRGGLVPF